MKPPSAATAFGVGDPWVASDGSYLIFTRWDRARDWSRAADLYITFNGPAGWSEPTPIEPIDDPSGPDYAVSIHADAICWKRRGGTFSLWPPILAALRQRGFSQEAAPRAHAGSRRRCIPPTWQ